MKKKDDGTDDDTKPIYNPLTIQEVATLINLAQNNNKKPKFSTQIAVYKDSINASNDLTKNKDYYKTWLNNNINSLDRYKCQVHINEDTLVVDYVLIWK